MFFRISTLLLLLLALLGCDLREDSSLPSGISPFDLLDEAIYITSNGLYITSQDSIYIRIKQEESTGFEFVRESYDFTPNSLSYHIEFVDAYQEPIEVEDFTPLLAFPSDIFTYLGLKYPGDYERFYPYPLSSSISGFGAYYEQGFCYLLLNDSGYYQTVSEANSHLEISVEIDTAQVSDINLSLYQAQFILPSNLIPLGVQTISFEKIESDNLAEYDLTLLDLPVNFAMVENNPDQERYPLLYIPIGSDSDMTQLSVKQIMPDQSEVIFQYTKDIDDINQFTTFGNCLILLVNNQGKFIVN